MAIIAPKRGEYFNEDGSPTLRFEKYLESLTSQTNENTDTAAVAQTNRGQALAFDIENRIGSGDFLTSDETGFTVDSDRLSCDMDEA